MNREGINIYKLLTAWYAFKEEKKLSGNHTDVFLFCVDLNNQLAWKEVFGLPTMASAQILNMSPNTFRKVLSDLEALGMIKIVKKAKNQMLASQISMRLAYQNLLQLRKSDYTAFVKAQQDQLRGTCAIDIHLYTNTLKQIDIIKKEKLELEKRVQDLLKKNEELAGQKKEKKPIPSFSDEIKNFTKDLLRYFDDEVVSKYTDTQLVSFCDTIDKLMRLDNETKESIEYVVRWARSDNFWKKNFNSLNKLRSKNPDKITYMLYFKQNIKAERESQEQGRSGAYSQKQERKQAEDAVKEHLAKMCAQRAYDANKSR